MEYFVKQASRKNSESAFSMQLKHRLREGLMILIAGTALFLFIALLTYHQSDPAWSSLGFNQSVANAGGRVGAWFADFLCYLLGYLAYVFPLLMGYGAWIAWCEEHREKPLAMKDYFLIRVIGFICIILSGAGLFQLFLPHFHAHLPYTSGGILGKVLSERLAILFNHFGTEFVLSIVLLIGITLLSGISWVTLTRLIIGHLLRTLYAMGLRFLHRFRKPKNALSQEDFSEDEDEPLFKTREKKLSKITKPKPAPIETIPTPSPSISHEFNTAIDMQYDAIGRTEAEISPKKSKKPLEIIKNKQKMTDALPDLSLLDAKKSSKPISISQDFLAKQSHDVEQRLKEFGVEVKVVGVYPGPVITRFELDLAAGIKVSKISGLAKDLARSLSTISVRVVEVIPGKTFVGLEIPNPERSIVSLREVFESPAYQQARSSLSLGLGKDIAGHPFVVDLAKMPHLLVAGTTGSGKSVALNVMLLSFLYKATPRDVRMILIDPKMLELSVYEGIPHLLAPVVTDMKQAANALKWCVAEMDKRYQLMAKMGVRNLAGYNEKIKDAITRHEPILHPFAPSQETDNPIYLEPLPHLVVLIDEFADMMMVVGKKVEELIARLAQKARAAGIHLILATQRPSVDVITGLIKANIPTRIAFQVSSRIDSRTIIDQQGAEQLLGHGDMLYLPPGSGIPIRVHGAYVADDEVHRVVAALKTTGEPDYISEILEGDFDNEAGFQRDNSHDTLDDLYDHAVEFVTQTRKVSISSIQRRFKIGYNRAARIVEEMERAGVVSSMESSGAREVLAPAPMED